MVNRPRDTMSMVLLVIFLATPIVLWFIATGALAWSGPANILRSIGQVSGLLGASLFSLNFILAARLRWLEDLLSGLPRMYNVHHAIGGTALILLLVHPLFLGLQYLPASLSLATSFFLPDLNNLPKLWGVLALSTLTGLLIITFYIRIAYHTWKSTHQWMGLALLFASLHVYLIPGNLSSAPGLRAYMVAVIILGLAAFVYRVLLGRWLVYRHPYEVTDVKVNNLEGTEVKLRPLKKPVVHYAGQFFFVRVHDASGITRESHPFSFTSAPNMPEMSFAAKPLGDYTNTLKGLKPSTNVDIEGPYGRFIFAHGSDHQVWVAGGIGITPFMSRVRELNADNEQKITLYYSVRGKKDALFAQELEEVAKTTNNFTLRMWESTSAGLISTDDIYQATNGANITYFICGPISMLVDMKKGLKNRGVKSSAIFAEEFKLY